MTVICCLDVCGPDSCGLYTHFWQHVCKDLASECRHEAFTNGSN